MFYIEVKIANHGRISGGKHFSKKNQGFSLMEKKHLKRKNVFKGNIFPVNVMGEKMLSNLSKY